MKNLKLFCIVLLLTGNLNAQYFQHIYGSPRSEHLESGVNADLTVAPQGHIMAGYTDLATINQLMVISTDLNGRVGFPGTFNKRYIITDPNQPLTDAQGRRVVQFGLP